MIGMMDDAFDDVHWVNVQDPIKNMFLALSKAIRVQSSSIRDLERRLSEMPTERDAGSMIQRAIEGVCSKQDATQILYQLDNKASSKEMHTMESRYSQLSSQMDHMNETISHQSSTITELQARNNLLEHELMQMKNPTYDQVFAYIDRQVAAVVSDLDRKLVIKADNKYVEQCVPERLEGLYRAMNSKINDLKVEVDKAATKDQFHALSNQKADMSELRTVAAELANRSTRHELNQSVNNHVKPLITALASLESAIQIQDNMVSYRRRSHSTCMLKKSFNLTYHHHHDYRANKTMLNSRRKRWR